MDKNSVVKAWYDFANNDLTAAKYLLGLHPLKLEIICYHCQQSAEKILKGFLIDKNIDPPKTHDFKLLWRMCVEIADGFELYVKIPEQKAQEFFFCEETHILYLAI
ncbi:MAG: hypothetical protein APF84_07820 [Gracilibacter sp. BRH_c7a]|nr:MAG: hypothetical protein APF84_07820 [Gracilibacter sp. BRH_c7a]